MVWFYDGLLPREGNDGGGVIKQTDAERTSIWHNWLATLWHTLFLLFSWLALSFSLSLKSRQVLIAALRSARSNEIFIGLRARGDLSHPILYLLGQRETSHERSLSRASARVTVSMYVYVRALYFHPDITLHIRPNISCWMSCKRIVLGTSWECFSKVSFEISEYFSIPCACDICVTENVCQRGESEIR